MTTERPILVNGTRLGPDDGPAVCLPLVSRESAGLSAEAARARESGPDLLEWRLDHFAAAGDTARVVETARAIRDAAPGIPLLLTRRSVREGGEPTSATEEQVVEAYRRCCSENLVELVDWEVSADPASWTAIRDAAGQGQLVVGSFHDFAATPDLDVLVTRFTDAQRRGADIAKVAVMPQRPGDVLTLLQAMLEAARELTIPVIGMAMGPLGVITRVFGHQFGSALTFAAGIRASAPGQLPIADLRNILAAVRSSTGDAPS